LSPVPRPGPSFARRAVLIGLWAGAQLAPPMARAQQAALLPDEPPQLQERYTSVLQRVQPGYVAPGITVGSFVLAPSLGISEGFDDNIFGVAHGTQSDEYTRFQPAVALQSQWSRNSFGIVANGTIDHYADLSTEDVADYSVTSSGLVQIGDDTILRAAVRAESDHQSRLSQDIFAVTIRPVRYTEQSGALSLTHDFNRLRITADAKFAHFDWDNGPQLDGSVLNQKTSNNNSYRLDVKAAYAQSPSFAWFVSASANDRVFELGTPETPKRNSTGYELLAGVDFEPVQLVRGSIGIGYIAQNFELPVYKDFAGLAFNGKVEFFPTQLTTVTISGDRSVLDSGIPGVGGYLSTDGTIRIDHELLRQLTLSATAGYQNNLFHNIDRVDDRVATSATATYRVNRYASLELDYDRLDQSSHGTARYRSYVDDRVQVGVTLRR